MPDEQVQAPQPTDRTRPSTNDPVWHLLFDRLDAQDENIRRAVENTVVVSGAVEKLRQHVNEEQGVYSELLEGMVRKGEVITDLLLALRHSRPAQAVLLAVAVAMAPVIVENWSALITAFRGLL